MSPNDSLGLQRRELVVRACVDALKVKLMKMKILVKGVMGNSESTQHPIRREELLYIPSNHVLGTYLCTVSLLRLLLLCRKDTSPRNGQVPSSGTVKRPCLLYFSDCLALGCTCVLGPRAPFVKQNAGIGVHSHLYCVLLRGFSAKANT